MKKELALNFRKYNDSELDEIAIYICRKLTNNEDHPDIEPLLAPVRITAEQFQHARRDASFGDTQKILIKNDLKEKLISLLRELGEIIQLKSKGDEWLLIRSGFEIAKPPKKTVLEKPREFEVLPGKNNGQIILQAKRVKGAKAYLYQYTPGPLRADNAWETVNSTKRKIVISDLPLGINFFFRMAAVGSRNQVVYSEILSRYIA
ncbi:hypothetical protein [Longitalea arenae]|uniref:hypothetical protein n=1 Tax=Longitalea arenae TaxID=2812558 RepID=UPI00196846CD|nr:hypothetical protein [Longitalea arenae]